MPIAYGVLASQCGVEPVSHRGWIQRVAGSQYSAHQRGRESNQMDTSGRMMLGFRRAIGAHLNAVARSSENGGL